MPGPAALIAAIVVRARGGHNTESGKLTTVALSQDERKQVGRLLGTPWELSGRPVRLQDLAARLHQHGLTVREFAETVHGGAIESSSIARGRAAAAAASERGRALTTLTDAGVDPRKAADWLTDRGLPSAGTGELLELVDKVVHVLLSVEGYEDKVWLAQLAADLFDNSHALDATTDLGRAVARLAAVAQDLPRPARAGRDWRAAWAAIGVTCDTVSSRVLVLNLPLIGDSAAAKLCGAANGEPIWLTLHSLNGTWHLKPASRPEIFVCENVTVAQAAAAELGSACPPLVSTDGIASGAALDLLAGLAEAGCILRARADFDQAGFTIADQVLSVAPDARSWRYDAHTYAALCDLSDQHSPIDELAAALPGLRALHQATRAAIHEERLLPALLADLTAGS
jgi:uncharacterized protein (TIGR02679 family)